VEHIHDVEDSHCFSSGEMVVGASMKESSCFTAVRRVILEWLSKGVSTAFRRLTNPPC
jgi:hypothetical protein